MTKVLIYQDYAQQYHVIDISTEKKHNAGLAKLFYIIESHHEYDHKLLGMTSELKALYINAMKGDIDSAAKFVYERDIHHRASGGEIYEIAHMINPLESE